MNVGDKIQLVNQEVEVQSCKECGKNMVNIDADQLAPGDLVTLKKDGVLVSNPETPDPLCVLCEYKPSFGHRLADWFSEPSAIDEQDSDDDDDNFFHTSGTFFGSSSYGGFRGGGGSSFGGFGGGSFSGGGASGGF